MSDKLVWETPYPRNAHRSFLDHIMGLCIQEEFKGTTLLKVGLAPSVKIMGWVGERGVGGGGGGEGVQIEDFVFCILC